MIRGLSKSEFRRLMRIKKKKKRKFIRPYSWEWKKLDESWRRPRGKDNKVRLQVKYRPPLVKIGYRTPKKVRHIHPSGMEEVIVHKIEDLYTIDPLTQAIRIGRTVGIRKRLEIINFARRFGIKILNVGRAEAYLGIEEAIIPEETAEEVAEAEGLEGLEELESLESIEEESPLSELEVEEEKKEEQVEEKHIEGEEKGEGESSS